MNNIIESWWRHNGCFDREQASGIPYNPEHADAYLSLTDEWWESLTNKEKQEIYEEFFKNEEFYEENFIL